MKNLILCAMLVLMSGCTPEIRDAVISGSIVRGQLSPTIDAVSEWIDGDEVAIEAISQPYSYLAGRYEHYKSIDQVTEVVPIILQRRAKWEKAKAEALKIKDALIEYESRSGKPMPYLVSVYITETEAFISAIDKALDVGDRNAKVAYATQNLGRLVLALSGVPELAALL